ncbi:hypothetical protein FJZ17_01550 [Candidatus Pacearchaeota archaeon]|nr:hypothetical protein [Candidatus Pacearchaeota archaeon]
MEKQDKEEQEKILLEYEKIAKENKLPDFNFLEENFEVELKEMEEDELIVRRIRKQIVEKISYHIRTLEAFLNPSNAPLFVMNMLKGFGNEEQEIVKNIYDKLGDFEIDSFGLEIEYNEKKEIEFIKNVCDDWKSIVFDLHRIHASMKKSFNKEAPKKAHKSYFG